MEEAIVPYLNTFALVLLLLISIGGVYLVIYIHDIPYEIAKKRNHPHQDAFHAAGWVSLFLMHSIWPILWIWAYWYKDGATTDTVVIKQEDEQKRIVELQTEIESLKKELHNQTQSNNKNIKEN